MQGLNFGLKLSPPWEGLPEALVIVIGAFSLLLVVLYLDRKLLENDLRMGTKAVWKLVKNCLEDETCEGARVEGQTTLESVQDSMSETERSERMGARARKKQDVRISEKGPPRKSTDKGENVGPTPPVAGRPSFAKRKGKTSLYPMKELEALNIKDSDTSESEGETLDSEEEAELEEEATRYEEERYHPDVGGPNVKSKSQNPPYRREGLPRYSTLPGGLERLGKTQMS